MKYIKVRWHHNFLSEPIWLYSELNDSQFELRKVEQYSDGHSSYASETERMRSSELSLEPIPEISEINKDSQFDAVEIDQDEFEKVWERAKSVET